MPIILLKDPNDKVSSENLEVGISFGSRLFYYCKLRHYQPKAYRDSAILIARMEALKFVLYVRITQGKERLKGVGATPSILLSAARKLKAQPFVVRVHLTKNEVTTIGFDEVEEAIKSREPHWSQHILKGPQGYDVFHSRPRNKSQH